MPGNGIVEVAVASDGTNALALQSAPVTSTSETELVGLLASQGVSPALQNPVLKLMSGPTELRSNDDWQDETNSDDIRSTTVPPVNAKESSILVRLEPGAYTAVVNGANETTGIALIEVYEIDHD
jgi:hypothetical protein